MKQDFKQHRLVAWVSMKEFYLLRSKLLARGKTISSWLREKIHEAIR